MVIDHTHGILIKKRQVNGDFEKILAFPCIDGIF